MLMVRRCIIFTYLQWWSWQKQRNYNMHISG